LQSFVEIGVNVEYDDEGIPRINSSNFGSSLALGKIDANFEAQPLKVVVARNLSFQVGF